MYASCMGRMALTIASIGVDNVLLLRLPRSELGKRRLRSHKTLLTPTVANVGDMRPMHDACVHYFHASFDKEMEG